MTTPLHPPFPWKQGQHMTLIGQTGTGKSTLASAILPLRQFSVIYQTAPDPDTDYHAQVETGSIKALQNPNLQRILLRPSLPRHWQLQIDKNPTDMLLEQVEKAYNLFSAALGITFWQGGWCNYLDELLHIDRLGLRPIIEKHYTEGRKRGISILAGLQRPVQVSRFALGESRHILSFGLEGRDAKEFGDATNQTAEEVVLDLDEYEFCWVHKPRGIWRGKLDLQTGQLQGQYVRT